MGVLAGCATATPAATPAAAGIAARVGVPAIVPTRELAGLTLNVGDQTAGLEALLTAAGELADVPYKIKWSTFTSGPPLLEAVNAGAVDVGGVGNTPPIFSAAAGGKIAIISAGRDSAAGDAVLVPKGSTARTFADLRGKRVAVAKGSSAHGNLLLQLKRAGLAPTAIQTTFIAPADGYAALAAGRVDAWVVWDPYTAQAEQQLGARVLTSGKGLANGLSWAQVYAQQTGLPYAVTLASALRSDDDPIILTPQLSASEQKLADAFAGSRVIPARPRMADVIDTRFNQAATDQGAAS
jgi:sulfonate transport system substrate-binding protein